MGLVSRSVVDSRVCVVTLRSRVQCRARGDRAEIHTPETGLAPQCREHARATLEALGDDDDGATVEVVVEGLVVVSGKGSRIPTVRVRRVNLRARATWSAAVACISVEINQCVGCT